MPEVWPFLLEPRISDTALDIYTQESRAIRILRNLPGVTESGEVWLVDGILKYHRLTGTHTRQFGSPTEEMSQTIAKTFVPYRRLVAAEIIQFIFFIHGRGPGVKPRWRITFADCFQVFKAFDSVRITYSGTRHVISCHNLIESSGVVTKVGSIPLHFIEEFIVSTGVIRRERNKHGYDVKALCFIAAHVEKAPRV